MSNTKLTGFYFPWPNLGIKLSRQWANLRSNTEKEAPLIRAAYVDPQPSSSNDPGNHDLAGWAIGERDFRNKFRIWYDKNNDRFSIQYNSGTEAVEVWDDYLSIRQVDGRVTIHGYGGLDSSVGGFYAPVPRNMAVSGNFFPAATEWTFEHNLGTSPILWNAFNLDDKSITPQSVDVSNPNIAYFYFATAQSGRAIATAEAARGEGIRITDGTNVFESANRLSFNSHDFYLSNEGHGMPVVNLQPIDLSGTDHGGLGDLTADDHPQYALTDGSRAITGDQTFNSEIIVKDKVRAGSFYSSTFGEVAYADQGYLTVTDTTASVSFSTVNKITFEAASFYLTEDSSGKPIVNFRGSASGSGSSIFGSGVKYQDFSAAAEWQFTHNLNLTTVVWAIYDDQQRAIIPDVADVSNPNTAYFYFNEAVAGKAVIIGGPVVNTISVVETDANPAAVSTPTIQFNSDSFYITFSSLGYPIINSNGSGGGGGSGVTDHGALTGLTDDDHSQYLLASDAASRAAFAANWTDLTDGGVTSLHSHAGATADPGFYGITWNDGVRVRKTDRLHFNDGHFYLDGSKPVLNIGGLPSGIVTFSHLSQDARNVTSDFFIGCTLHKTSLAVSSNGSTITATWSDASAGQGIKVLFNSGITTVAAAGGSVAATLTAGTDTSPQVNYLYILPATPTVLTVSTTGYPDATTVEHAKVGYIMVQSAATVQTYGPLIADSTPDAIHYDNASTTGHATHINEWIKAQPATWGSGVAATGTVNTGPTPDTVSFSTTSGTVYQIHPRTFPAFTDPAAIYVVNHPSGAYTRATTMPGLTSGGSAIGGSDRIIVVLWGAINDATGDCKLFLNLPSGYYGSNAAAIADDSKYGNYTIPAAFKGTGFLIASFIYTYTTASGGTYTLLQQTDLRGLVPSAFPGGTTAKGTEFADSAFRINDNSDATKQIAFEASGITTGTTRTLTVQDRDGTIALTDQLAGDFYYLVVKETDGNPPPFRTKSLTFDSTYFYLNPNSNGKPIVSLRSTSSGSGTALTVRDEDGTPTATNVSTIRFTNGAVTDNGGGDVSVSVGAGGGGIATLTIGGQSFGSQTTLGLNSADFYLSGGATSKVLNLRQQQDVYKGHLPGVIVDNLFIEPDADHAFTVMSASLDCRAGSATVGFYIVSESNLALPGRAITGLDGISVGATKTTSTATALNTMNVGDRLVLSIYGVSGAEHLVYTVRLRKTTL